MLADHPNTYWALYVARQEGLGRQDWLASVFPEHGEANLDGDPVQGRLELEMPQWALAESEARWRSGERLLSVGARLARLYSAPDRQRERLAIGMQLLATPARSSLAPPWQLHLLELAYPNPWPELVREAAFAGGVPTTLLLGLVRQESAFNHLAVSSAGAMGLTQLMPATAQEVASRRHDLYTIDAVHIPGVAMRWGADYLAGQLDAFQGDLPAALVAYNAGPSRAGPWQDAHPARAYQSQYDPLRLLSIDLTETRLYVRAVLRNSWIYERLVPLAPNG